MAESALLKRFEVAIDLKRPVAIRPFEVVEGDTGNVIEITLTDDGTPVDMTGLYVTAVFSTANGISVQSSDESVTIDSNRLTVALMPSSFAPGLVECELQIYSTSEGNMNGRDDLDVLVTSAKFNFSCRRAILNGDSIEATPQLPMLTELINSTTRAEEERAAAEAARISAEAARVLAENARAAAETNRSSAEAARVSAEQARQLSEYRRGLAEENRAEAEAVRAAAEEDREAAEAERQAAETAREEAISEFLENAGPGMSVSASVPTEQTTGSEGELKYVQSTGELYVCQNSILGPNRASQWKRIAYDGHWTRLRQLQLSANTNAFEIAVDNGGEPFEFNELRLIVIGGMTGGTSVNIYVNGGTSIPLRDTTFLNRDCVDISENIVVVTFHAPEYGFIKATREGGGTGSVGTYSSIKSMQSMFLKAENFTGYTGVKVSIVGTTAQFVNGTKIIVEGRNIWK